MTVVTWNCNEALRKKYEQLMSFNADVLVIQECENPKESTKQYQQWAGEHLWIGTNKNRGLGVFFKTKKIELLDWSDNYHPWKGEKLELFIPSLVEYEQNGADRAEYGAKIIENLVQKLKHIKGMSATNLRLFRVFYTHYPQIGQTVSVKSLGVPIRQLLYTFSFSHFIELLKIDDSLKRLFYEVEGIRGNWNVRELRRQINAATYERIGLSKNRKERENFNGQQ